MTVQDVCNWLDSFAPFAGQEGFDNAGLLVGNPNAKVRRVLFALDATLPVVREAEAWQADLLITHHPLMFGGVKAIRYDQPEGAALAAIVVAGMHLIAAHTNLDKATGGMGDALASLLELETVAPTLNSPYLRSGNLLKPQPALTFLQRLNTHLHAHARMYGNPNASIARVTVGTGAIGEDYPLAAADGSQAYVVGEIKHHELLAAQAMGLVIFETGHHETEFPGMKALYERFLSAALAGKWPVQARLTTIQPYDCTTL